MPRGGATSPLSLIGNTTCQPTKVFCTVNNGYLWKSDEHLNHVAKVRYEHGDELTDLPGVVGLGLGKDHIIVYVSSDGVEVPDTIEDVRLVKVRRP